MSRFLILVLFAVGLADSVCGAQTKPVSKPGIKTLQLATDHNQIAPGMVLQAGLFIQHLPSYHTYWKGPGIAGVPTSIKWSLPEGFKVSEMRWPAPQRSKMASYNVHGYKRDVTLVTEIFVPDELSADSITLHAEVAFMCCSMNCHPGWHEFSLTLPVANGKTKPSIDNKWQARFKKNIEQVPPPAPEILQSRITEISDQQVTLQISHPAANWQESGDTYCFCETGLIHSDRPQKVAIDKDGKHLIFHLPRSEFAEKEPRRFDAVLFYPHGWPGTDSKWVRISTPIKLNR